MRRFLASAWFPFLMCLVLAGVAALAYAVLQPSGEAIGNSDVENITKLAAWGIGPVFGLLSLLVIGVLNVIRRVVRLRKVSWLHPLVVLLGIAPWVVFSWVLLDEPPYTPIANAVKDFAARELLWGSLVACLLTLLLSIPLLFPAKKT
jgi:hypothetical protein